MSHSFDLLVIGAHPDDAEIHSGGLIALASSKHMKTAILDLSEGELGSRGDRNLRKQESHKAAQILGCERFNLQLPDGGILDTPVLVDQVVTFIRLQRPKICVLPYPFDRHPDHRNAHSLLQRAVFLSGLSRYPCNEKPWRPEATLWVGGENPSVPEVVVDISSVWSHKIKAIQSYRSQFDPDFDVSQTRISHPSFMRGIEGRSMHWGSLIQSDHGEAFWFDKPMQPVLISFLDSLR